MKNNKGFVGIFLLMILAAVVIGGGGAYIYIYTNRTPQTSTLEKNDISLNQNNTGETENPPVTSPVIENKTLSQTDTNCGVSTFLSSGGKKFTNAEYEQDTALSCLGKKILSNCENGEVTMYDNSSATNIKISTEGTTAQNCVLKILYPAAENIKSVNLKKYANKDISCPVFQIVKDTGLTTDPHTYPAAYSAGLLQYIFLSTFFAPDKLEKIGCTGDLLAAFKRPSLTDSEKIAQHEKGVSGLAKLSLEFLKAEVESAYTQNNQSYGKIPFALGLCKETPDTFVSGKQVIGIMNDNPIPIENEIGRKLWSSNRTCVSTGVSGKVNAYAISVPFFVDSEKSWCIDNTLKIPKEIIGSVKTSHCE